MDAFMILPVNTNTRGDIIDLFVFANVRGVGIV